MQIALPESVRSFIEIVEIEADDCTKIKIESDNDMNSVSSALRSIKSRMKELEQKRLEITRPIDDSKRRVMDLFRPIEDKLAKAERAIKSAILDYNRRIEEETRRLQEEENKRAAEAAKAKQAELLADAERAVQEGKAPLAVAYLDKAESIAPAPIDIAKERRPEGISIPKIWKFRVVDPSKVPDQFKVIDEKKLGAYAKAMKDKAEVDGVEFFEEATVAARSY